MKVSTPHFTILTADSTDDAKDWAVGLEAYRQSLQAMAGTDDRMLDAVTIVVFKNERAYKAVARQGEKEDFYTISSSRFVSQEGHFFGAVNPDDAEAARHSVFLQAGIWLTSSYRWPLPLWLVTGLQQIYDDCSLSSGRIYVGGAIGANTESLKGGLHLPLDQMLGMTTSSDAYQKPDGHFNAQAWAFVHYLLLGDHDAHRATLAAYMQAIQRGDDADASQKLLYPDGLPELSRRFTRFVNDGGYRMETLSVNVGAIVAQVSVSPAPEAEVQTALGYLHLYFQSVGAAAPYFDRVVELAPQDPATLEAEAELANARGDQVERQRYYQEAVQAGSKSYLAHYYAFYPAVQAFYGSEAAADATDPAAARQAVDGIKDMLRLRPGFYAGYETLAGLMGSLAEANPDDRVVLQEGRKYFPGDAVLESGQAAYEILTRSYVSAKNRLDRVLSGDLAHADRIRHYAEKLRARLNAANRLYWLEKFYAAQDFDNVEKLLPALARAPLLPVERERLAAVRAGMSTREMLGMVKEAIARKDFTSADALLAEVENTNLSVEMRKEVSALRASIATARSGIAKQPASAR